MSTVFRDYKAGEVVFRQGDAGDCAYLIESGCVQISVSKSGEEFPVNILGEGQIFGEMAIIDNLSRSATATALEPVRLCVIPRDSLMERLRTADPIVRLLTLMLVKRTRELNQGLMAGLNQDVIPEEIVLNKEAQQKVRFESEIKSAFANREFYMNYQPVVELKTARITGFEALIRWKSPTLGIVPPGQFMSAIEESSIMMPVGRWIIEQAMRDAQVLAAKCGPHLAVNINISPRQFLDPFFISHLEQTRTSLGVPVERIKLEITEQIFVQSAATVAVIERCRKLGYQLCLDDFGTGYSSISYLKQMELDVLKIDQSFIRVSQMDQRSKSIIQSIIDLGSNLGMACVAEGIENSEIAAMLVLMGCGYGQGYHYGRPQGVDFYLNEAA